MKSLRKTVKEEVMNGILLGYHTTVRVYTGDGEIEIEQATTADTDFLLEYPFTANLRPGDDPDKILNMSPLEVIDTYWDHRIFPENYKEWNG